MATQEMDMRVLLQPTREEELEAEVAKLEAELYEWRKLSLRWEEGSQMVEVIIDELKPLWAKRARMLEVLGR